MDGAVLNNAISLTGRDLKSALALMMLVTQRRGTVPVLSMAMIRSGSRVIIGTDLDQQLTVPIGSTGTLSDAALLPVRTVRDFARSLGKAEALTLRAVAGSTGVGTAIECCDGDARFSGLNPDDFPLMPFEAGPVPSFEVDAQVFVDAIRRLKPCISTEETRYYLNGIYMHPVEQPTGRVLRLVATDGHQIGLRDLGDIPGLPAFPGMIVPHCAIRTLLAVIGKQTGTVKVELSTGLRVRFTLGDYELVAKLIDGTYPDYERVLPAAVDRTAVILPRLATIAAAARCAAFPGGGNGLTCSIADGILTMTAKNFDADQVTRRVPVTGALPTPFGVNPRHLINVLNGMSGETVKADFAAGGGYEPIRFTAVDREADGLFVVMPMRV